MGCETHHLFQGFPGRLGPPRPSKPRTLPFNLAPLLVSPPCDGVLILSHLALIANFFQVLHMPFARSFWDDDDDAGEEIAKEHACQELADFLVHLKQRGRLSAKDVCTIALYCKTLGIGSPVADLAFRLNAPSGHYNRHLKTVLKIDEALADSYTLGVPSYDKWENERFTLDIPVLCPHEVLSQEVKENPALVSKLEGTLASRSLPPCYFEHEVTVAAPATQRVWPICLYLDGVPFTKRDGTIAFYVYNMMSDVRHLVVAIRKSQMCSCGCAGWCTLHPVWTFLMWSLCCLAMGMHPDCRHDFTAFSADDQVRARFSGLALMLGALLHIKGDWSEVVNTVGFASWRSVLYPCFACVAMQDQLTLAEGFSMVSAACALLTKELYERAREACEFIVRVPCQLAKATLIGLLVYDKRKKRQPRAISTCTISSSRLVARRPCRTIAPIVRHLEAGTLGASV